MNVNGACLCGHITFSAVIDPDKVIVCHCTDCQRHAATAFGVVVRVVDEQFELHTGTMKTYVKTAESGTKRALTFCPECGTRIYAKTVGEGMQFTGLRTGTLEQCAELVPSAQVYYRSSQPWIDRLNDIPAHESNLASGLVSTDKNA